MLTEMNQHNGKDELTKGQKRLPVINPKVAAVKSLKAAKNGRAVYTPPECSTSVTGCLQNLSRIHCW